MLAFQPDKEWTFDEYMAKLKFPLLATPKIDGVRCLIVNGVAVSRTLKPIPNQVIRSYVSNLPEGFDGEIVCPGGFHSTQSAVMTQTGTPPFKYMVFDCYHPHLPYWERITVLKMQFAHSLCAFAEPVLYHQLDNVHELELYEAECLAAGYEGVMLRHPEGRYKFGRSTLREAGLLKVKRFEYSTATIVGYEELRHNENADTTNALGLSERSSHQVNQRPGNTMGALRVRDSKFPNEFAIGSGFTSTLRDTIWQHRDSYLGRPVRYRYQPYGCKDAPRCPTFGSFEA